MAVYNPFDFFLEESATSFPFAYDDVLRKDLAPFLERCALTPQFAAYLSATKGDILDGDVIVEWYTDLNRYARVKTHTITFGTIEVDVKLLAAMAERPADIAILDIGLPGMDGYELATRLRANKATSTMKLIALSGYAQPSDRARSNAAGFDRHLVKPVDVRKLIEEL